MPDLTIDVSTPEQAIERLSEVVSFLAGSGMEHEMFDRVYSPLLQIRAALNPDWWRRSGASTTKPLPHVLWKQSCDEWGVGTGQQRVRYRELLREHGHLVDKQPGDDDSLACGWPGEPK